MILFPSTRSVPSSYIPSPVVVVVVLVHIPGAWHVEAAPCVPFFLAHPFNMHCTIQNSVLTGWKTANCTYQKVVEITQVQLVQTMGRQSVSQGQSWSNETHFNHSSHSEILHSLHSHAHSSVLSPDFSCFFLWKWVRWKPHRLTRFSFFLPWFHTVKAKKTWKPQRTHFCEIEAREIRALNRA